jgi:formylglycine-generating enzyme required for sulfatase activity
MKMKIAFGVILLVGCMSLSVHSADKRLKKHLINVLNENYALILADSLINYDFLIFKTEVSNLNYKEFLWDLKQQGETDKWKRALVDSSKWSDSKWNNNAYVTHYHNHTAYNDYPVVNVSKESAELYCEWLSEKVNNTLNEPYKIVFRLPIHKEWLKAARGTMEGAIYAWSGYRLQNTEGTYLCNCIALGSECISRDSTGKYNVMKVDYDHLATPGNYADLTAPVKSYWPNGYGLYNMNGNVAELISDKEVVAGGSWNDPGFDVRNESVKRYEGAARTVGFRVVATIVPSEHAWLKVPKKKTSRE